MSASCVRVLGLVVSSAWLAAGCSKGMTIQGSDGASGGGGTGGSLSSSPDASDALPADVLGSTAGTTGSGDAPGTGGSSGLDAPIGVPPADFNMTDRVDLGTVLVGASVSGKVTVTATNPLTDLICAVSSAGNLKPDPSTTTCPTAVPGALVAGASCFVGFIFGPSTAGVKTGDEIICTARNVTRFTPITATVTTGSPGLAITPPSGSIPATLGKSNSMAFTVANRGNVKTGTITAAIVPPNPEFVVSGSTCAAGLPPLGTCTVTVSFQPITDGTKTAILVVTDSDQPAISATALVTGIAEALECPTSIGNPDLGTVALGETGTPVTFTLKNVGGTDVIGIAVTSNNSVFVVGNDTCTGMTIPKTTGTCTFTVTFVPSKDGLPGVYSGLLTVSFGGGSPCLFPITATAIKPASDAGVSDAGGPSDGGTGDGFRLDAAIPDGSALVRVAVSPPVLDFGTVDVGQTSSTPSSVTVTNLGPATSLAPVIVQPSPFSLARNTCSTLPANGTCIISVVFAPMHTGPAAGTLVVAGSVSVTLSGIGSPPADFTQTDRIDLGTVVVGASVSGKVTVTATNPLTDLFCAVVSAGNIKEDPITTSCPTAAPGPLAKGASCSVGFTFSSATAGAKTGDEVICGAGNVTKITSVTALVLTGAKLLVTPSSAQTAATAGKSSIITFTVANAGGATTGSITAAITPPNPEFVVSGTTCTVGLLPLGTCTVTVTFQPLTDGTKTATLAVSDAAAPAGTLPTTATITGLATGPSNLVITGGPDLGTVALGQTGTPVTFTIKNIGSTDVTVVTVTTNNSVFVVGNDTCTGLVLPKTTGTCTVTVTFAPSASGLPGAYAGLLSASSTPGSPFNLPITATAIKPAVLTITPNPLVFEGILLNTQSGDRTLTVTNAGGASTGTLTLPSALGNGFVVSGNTCSAPLLPTQSCTMSIRYTPGTITQSTWNFTVTSASGAFATAQLIGTGA